MRMTAQSSVNNLLGKIRNKAVIALLIDGTIDKQRLSGTLTVRTVFCLSACLFACLVASLVTVPRVLPAIKKVAVLFHCDGLAQYFVRRIFCGVLRYNALRGAVKQCHVRFRLGSWFHIPGSNSFTFDV